jgi:hypothetical protein
MLCVRGLCIFFVYTVLMHTACAYTMGHTVYPSAHYQYINNTHGQPFTMMYNCYGKQEACVNSVDIFADVPALALSYALNAENSNFLIGSLMVVRTLHVVVSAYSKLRYI